MPLIVSGPIAALVWIIMQYGGLIGVWASGKHVYGNTVCHYNRHIRSHWTQAEFPTMGSIVAIGL